MPNWVIEVDLDAFKGVASEFAAVVTAVGPDAFPRYAAEAEAVSENAEIRYKGYLLGQPIPNGKVIRKPAKEAAESVQRRAAGVLQWDLLNTSDAAKRIEEGSPEFDMKTVLPKSKKARMAKDGTLYLIIPFRHGNPNATGLNPMPKAVYKMARQLEYSYQLGTVGTRLSGTGHLVPKFGYQWGDKLTQEKLAAAGLSEAQQRRYQGLYRFNGPKHSTFITFRTMSQKSSGWIKPATPGFFPLQEAIRVSMEEGMPKLALAVQEDFVSMIGG